MQALDTLQIQDNRGDLSGTRVTANKPVGMFSGNIRVHVTYDGISTTGSRDHLVEQVPPISSYGFHFAMMTTPDRSVGDDYKFVASEPDTRECSLKMITLGIGVEEPQRKADFCSENTFWALMVGLSSKNCLHV